MTAKSQREVILMDSGTIVLNTHQFHSALLDIDVQPGGIGIEAVFQ